MQSNQQVEPYNQVTTVNRGHFWNLPSFSGVLSWFLSLPLGIALPLREKKHINIIRHIQ